VVAGAVAGLLLPWLLLAGVAVAAFVTI